MCKCCARARILRIGICRSEQKRGPAGDTTAGPKDREEDVLRGDGNLRHPAALQSARRNSDHGQRDADFRARDDQIKVLAKLSLPKGRAARRGSAAKCFLFLLSNA